MRKSIRGYHWPLIKCTVRLMAAIITLNIPAFDNVADDVERIHAESRRPR